MERWEERDSGKHTLVNKFVSVHHGFTLHHQAFYQSSFEYKKSTLFADLVDGRVLVLRHERDISETREEEVAHALVDGHRIRLLLSPSLLNLNTRQSAVERLVKADCGNNIEEETKAAICSTVAANLGQVQSTKVRAWKRERKRKTNRL